MVLKLSNNASGRLALGIEDNAISLTLETGQGARFPSLTSGEYFPLTVVRADNPSQLEIMHCTGRSGDTLTIVRAQEGTAALTFSAGDVAELRLTAGIIESEFPQASGQGKRIRFSVSDENAIARSVDGGEQSPLVVEGGNVASGLVSGPSMTFRADEMDGDIPDYAAGIRFRSQDTFGHLRVMFSDARAWIQGGIDPTINTNPDLPFWTREIAFKDDVGNILGITGKRMLFLEATAPPGWTQDTSINDRVLRVVNSAGGGLGGSWTLSGLSASVLVGATTLSVAQTPLHQHETGVIVDGSVNRQHAYAFYGIGSNTGSPRRVNSEEASNVATAWSGVTTGAGAGYAHNHSASASISSDGSWRPAYVDVIACRKD